MAEGARMMLLDKKIARHDELLADLLNSQQDVRNTQTGIQGTLKLILERLNTIERRSIRVPYLNCDETGICVCSIDCECAICIGSDTTCPESIGYCARSIDCECDICIRGDTSTGSEGLNYDETEINRPFDFHVLDDSQVQLDSLVLRCTRGLDLSSLCFSTWLNCVEIKATRVASYLFDKMSKRDHLQVVHVFIEIKSEFSRVLLKKGLVVPIWDPGIGLEAVKLVGHTNNVRELLIKEASLVSEQDGTGQGSGRFQERESDGLDKQNCVTDERKEFVAPAVGMEFESYDDAYNYYNCYAREADFRVRVKNSWFKRNSWEKYGAVPYCSSQGFKRIKEVYRLHKETRTGCPAMIRMRMVNFKIWRVLEVTLEHSLGTKAYKSIKKTGAGRSGISCERAKRTLFSTTHTITEVDSLFKGIEFYATITRARFEELCMSMSLKNMDRVGKCLSDANVDKIQIEDVLVGRSTRIQKIPQPLKDCFDKKKLYTSINMDVDESYGAAVLDVILIGNGDEKVQELLVVDSTLLDLGLEIVGGMIIVLNSRNATIAIKDEQIFPTYSDHQFENAPIEKLIHLNYCNWHWQFCGCSIQPVIQERFNRCQIECLNNLGNRMRVQFDFLITGDDGQF